MLPEDILDNDTLVTVVGLHGLLVSIEGDALTVRKGARELLRAASTKGKLVVWSSADKVHTELCLSKLQLQQPPDSVVTSDDWEGPRDASVLGVSSDRLVLIDCHLSTVAFHPSCSILVPYFKGAPGDNALVSLLEDYAQLSPPVSLAGLLTNSSLLPTPVHVPYPTRRRRYVLHAGVASLVFALLVDRRAVVLIPLVCTALSKF